MGKVPKSQRKKNRELGIFSFDPHVTFYMFFYFIFLISSAGHQTLALLMLGKCIIIELHPCAPLSPRQGFSV